MNSEEPQRRRKKSVADALKKRARQLTDGTRKSLAKSQNWDLMIPSMLKREISLTLEHIDRVRQWYNAAKESLLDQECYLGTELLGLDTLFGYSQSFAKRPERERILGRLSHVEGERRRLAEGLEIKLQALNKELLMLLERHAQIDVDQ